MKKARKLNWQGYSSGDRSAIIEKVKQKILSCGAYVVNFKLYSDYAIFLSIEIEESGIEALHNSLSKSIDISDFEELNYNPNSDEEIVILLNISFKKGSGKLRSEIPAVPG